MPGGCERKFKVLTMDPPPITACPDLPGLCLNACSPVCPIPGLSSFSGSLYLWLSLPNSNSFLPFLFLFKSQVGIESLVDDPLHVVKHHSHTSCKALLLFYSVYDFPTPPSPIPPPISLFPIGPHSNVFGV